MGVWFRCNPYETSEAEEYSLAKENVKATKKPEHATTIKISNANMSTAMILYIIISEYYVASRINRDIPEGNNQLTEVSIVVPGMRLV